MSYMAYRLRREQVNKDSKLRHTGPGILSMANAGKDTNGKIEYPSLAILFNITTQVLNSFVGLIILFAVLTVETLLVSQFICTATTSWLDGKHVSRLPSSRVKILTVFAGCLRTRFGRHGCGSQDWSVPPSVVLVAFY